MNASVVVVVGLM